MENTHNFLCPPVNLIGVGAIKDLPLYLMPHKLSKVLIVTDKNLIKLGYLAMVEVILKNLFISYDVFDGVLHPNSTISFVEDGFAYFDKGINILKRDYKLIISIGGGTNHDCAKGIAIVATNGGKIADYEGYNKMTKRSLPVIAINTTAGSASELTSFAIVLDESRRSKLSIADSKMIPIISVNDPMFMTTMPPEVTASSGIDVVTHAIESFCSLEASPITDALAINALRIAFTYLRRSYENGNDMEAREQMMHASIMAGFAFNNAGLGLVHALSHQVGGFYKQIHGDCNAVLLPSVFAFNSVSIPEERIYRLCAAMGENTGNVGEAVNIFREKIQGLSKNIGLPANLRALEVDEDDIGHLSENAVKDISAVTNPRQATVADVVHIYRDAL